MNAASTPRRTVLAVAGTVPLAATLAACGSDGGSGKDGGYGGGKETKGSDGPSDEATGDGGDKPLTSTADIPEGGGKVFPSEKVVVTQPRPNEFKAYSAVCTHSGCLVNKVADGTVFCPCHNSEFSIEDGSVTDGPARRPLPKVNISVEGGDIRLA